MNQDPYLAFSNAKGNAVSAVLAWVGSVLGPAYIFIGWGKYDEWFIYLGVGLSIYVLHSIGRGLKSFGKGIYSDFIVYSLIPVLIPIVTVVAAWVYNV